jgi:uncharacterized protein YegJ (DUF2314 family)
MRAGATAVVVALLLGVVACERGLPEGVYQASTADAVVNAAMEEARASLPAFWKAYESTDGTREKFVLKVRLESPSGMAEHVWMGVTGRQGNVVHGLLANEPAGIPGLHLRSPLSVTTDKISDWGYERDGKLYGNFTSRVLIGQMSAEDKEALERMLSPTPVEPELP